MPNISQEMLVGLLIRSFVCGVLLGVFYDIISFFKLMLITIETCGRYKTLHRVILFSVTFVTDVIFWIAFAVTSILLVYKVVGGAFRFSVYIMLLLGVFLYRVTFGRLLLTIRTAAARLLGRLAAVTVRYVLFRPLKGLFFVLIKIYHLTIGQIIDKIYMAARHGRKSEDAEHAYLSETQDLSRERCTDAYDEHGYGRKDRICFSRRRDDGR